jgi:Na+-transporting NADH:ubiquinone oxidoreductase subunit E
MESALNLLLRAMFVENLALVFLLGMCTYLAVSKRVETAMGLGAAMIVVQVITVPINNALYQGLLAPEALAWAGLGGLDLSFMKLIAFIGVIAASVQILEMTMNRYMPTLATRLGTYLPLLTVNCAILGASLLMVQRNYDFAEATLYGLGTGVGWAFAIVLFAAIRERLRYADSPRGLEGLGIAFIVTGLLALGFAGFTGLQV